MRTVHLIHGFNERHKLQRPKLIVLGDELQGRGFDVRVHDYGHWDLVATRNNSNLARLIFPSIEDGDTLIGFSNGAALIAHLLRLGAKPKRVVLIQPALGKRWKPPACVKHITVFHNEGDMATVAGKWWRRATSLLPWRWQEKHNWGEMGHTGYIGDDKRFVQYKTDEPSRSHVTDEWSRLDLPKARGHSGWSYRKNAAWWKIIVSHA